MNLENCNFGYYSSTNKAGDPVGRMNPEERLGSTTQTAREVANIPTANNTKEREETKSSSNRKMGYTVADLSQNPDRFATVS